MGTMPRPFTLVALFSLLPFITSLSSATSISAPSPTAAAAAAAPVVSPTPVSRSPTSHSTLDPKQLRALQSLNIPTSKDPCSNPTTSSCDDESPFRHLLSLRLVNCSDDVEMSATALKSLSSLTDLELINCPVAPVRFPSELALNLRSFTCINSFRRLTGVWLSRLQNITDLNVTGVTVNASGPSIILGNMKKIQSVTISQANLVGFLPKHWHLNISHIDLSGNKLRGKIPSSLTSLENLQIINLSSNQLQGEIPDSIGDLMSLQNISLSSNSLTGPVPELMAAIPNLVHLDLGSNRLNGTIPKFIADMKSLKYLNLEQNNFNGIMPFNVSFIKKLEVFKIGGNSNLCYNQTTMPGKVKLGIAPCNKRGLPMSPPPAKDSSEDDSSPKDDDYNDSDSNSKVENHRGPSKVVLGVAIGISSIVFLIVFMILLSKWCG